ncbi:phosphoesteras-like protein [Periconia macrospinosa]|uniref:Phosphoesteras-like protein n=1 Tax=Periconia macrospinosa TaxID=97972 RepID=A0A2V1E7Q5_9PLEO|nr:phosphoesteras-like protein [Periconia macrospinosa]
MTRRIVRTGIQLGFIAFIVFFLVVFLDNRYRVLPQAIHGRLPLHHEGLIITDLTIQTCSTLNPISKCQLDPEEWHRIEKDLYLGSGWVSRAYVHIKRKKEEDLTEDDRVIVDVRTAKLDPAMGDKSQASEKWEARPAGVWIKRSSKRHASDSKNTVTAVDVLFGADAVEPRPGWSLVPNGALRLDGGTSKEPRLTVRRGQPRKIEKSVPRIRKDGKFKIMQVSDLHLSTGLGVCRDPEPKGHNGGKCDADPRTLEFVERVLDEEKPDMVVLSGDQVNGGTAPDVPSALFKIVDVLVERKIPYAAVFGNHDDEGVLSRQTQMQLYESLPFSLSEAGPTNIDGVGNYYVEILAHGNNKHSAVTLYFLDTHSYSPDETKFKGYDWIKPNQIAWFNTAAETLKASDAHVHYSHTHLNMAFIHIPLPEYRIPDNGWYGNWKEGVTAPGFNTHFKDALVKQGVKAVSCGHDHANDYCMPSKNEAGEPELWMCYAGGSGFGGYGGYGGYHRRLRVFEIDTNQARITTWKRLEYGDTAARLDEQIIVDSGKVRPIPQAEE